MPASGAQPGYSLSRVALQDKANLPSNPDRHAERDGNAVNEGSPRLEGRSSAKSKADLFRQLKEGVEEAEGLARYAPQLRLQ